MPLVVGGVVRSRLSSDAIVCFSQMFVPKPLSLNVKKRHQKGPSFGYIPVMLSVAKISGKGFKNPIQVGQEAQHIHLGL